MLHKVLWKSLLVTPALMGAAMIANSAAIASEALANTESAEALTAATEFEVSEEVTPLQLDAIAPAEVAQTPASEIEAPAAPVAVEAPATEETTPSVVSLDEIMEYSADNGASLDQVTSISQLSDVRPTDWAFQALQSLVERYGCIAGYPDGTFRGQNFATRFEMAAALNACMDRVSELIAAGLADAVTREDLATLQRLQEEFAAELATLRGRVDALEARVSELEANQFSTTTKLRGEVIFSLSAPFDYDDDLFDDQVEFANRVRLDFDTSFTGEDRLRTRFQARNVNGAGDSDPIGFSYGGNNGNTFDLDDLIYTFPIGSRIEATIGTNSVSIDDMVASTISPLDSSGSGSISDFGFPRQYSQGDAGSGAGAGLIIQFAENFSLDFGYVGDEQTNEGEGSGFFNGDYGIIGQLTYLSDFVDAAFTYVNAYDGGGFDPPGVFSVTPDGPAVANTYGAQVNFKLADDFFNIGGGVAFTDVTGIGARPDYDVWSWQVTAAVNDLGGDGSMLGILAGVPPYTRDLGGARDTSFLAELFYRYRLNSNILITPSIIWLADPYNDNDIDDTIIGTLRTTFRF
jgi:BMFP domain-containing protein YqiC